MRRTFLVLVIMGNLKGCFVGMLHKRSNITPLTKKFIAPTYITKKPGLFLHLRIREEAMFTTDITKRFVSKTTHEKL